MSEKHETMRMDETETERQQVPERSTVRETTSETRREKTSMRERLSDIENE